MSLAYIRKTYNVNAKRGVRVEWYGGAVTMRGTITGSKNALLRIRLDGEKHSFLFHPTDKLIYL